MLLWWLTAAASLKPLASMVTKLLYASAFLYMAQDPQVGGLQEREAPREVAVEVPPAGATTSDALDPTSAGWDPFFDDFTVPNLDDVGDEAAAADVAKGDLPILGVYNYRRSSNFNNYLKELGVSYMLRTLAGMATPVVTITKQCPAGAADLESCDWTVRTDTLFKKHSVTFRLGRWGRDVTMDGRAVEYRFRLGEGRHRTTRLVEEQRSGGKETTLVRDFTGAGMDVTLTVNGVVSTSFFARGYSSKGGG